VILLLQGLLFAIGADAVRRLPPMPAAPSRGRPDLLGGIKATWRHPLIRSIVTLNFLSSLFNAGAYTIAIPYIVKDVYGGDAAMFSAIIMVFTAGSIGSNVIMLRFMPLLRPGRLFLLMQPTRVLIFVLLWFKPPIWLFYTSMVATVQELAGREHRGQILSVLLVSFMISTPVSSIVLGKLIEGSDPLTALLPGIAMSLLIFVMGLVVSGLWRYEAPTHPPAA
jgi:hypothetical protein